MCTTYCCQEEGSDFHSKGQEMAAAELASLYEAVKNMPEGSQKTYFMKKVKWSSG